MNKKWTLTGLVVISGLFFLFAPGLYKDKLVGLATFNSDERKCFNHYKEALKNPSSAYLISSYILKKETLKGMAKEKLEEEFGEYDAILKVKLQAKNGFGAYGAMYVGCPLVNGKFNDNETFLYRTRSL